MKRSEEVKVRIAVVKRSLELRWRNVGLEPAFDLATLRAGRMEEYTESEERKAEPKG